MGFFDTIETLLASKEGRLQEAVHGSDLPTGSVDGRLVGETKKKTPSIPEKQYFLPPCGSCEGQQPEAVPPLIVGSVVKISLLSTPVSRMVTSEQENFVAAWPWIKNNLEKLLAAGWTRAALFCRGKLRHPVGNWGIAWLSVWRRPMLTVKINSRGAIVFIFEICGRRITQAAYPR